MKKVIFILVMGLLLSGNTYAKKPNYWGTTKEFMHDYLNNGWEIKFVNTINRNGDGNEHMFFTLQKDNNIVVCTIEKRAKWMESCIKPEPK